MEIKLSNQAMFLYGIGLTGGRGRLYSGESNKYISDTDSGIVINGTNLYINGTEVIVNQETLAANGMIEADSFDITDEQGAYFLAGLIAGMYQPEKRPVRWAYLTFIVDEETLIKADDENKIYEIPNDSLSEKQAIPEDQDEWIPTSEQWPPSEWVEVIPDENGFITLDPNKKYVSVSTGGGGAKVPSSAIEEEEEEIIIPEPEPEPGPVPEPEPDDDDKKTITDYIDDDGNEMTKIEIPLGHNKIVIYFLQSDKTPDGSWYRVGADITIEAVPGGGWEFVQWTIDESLIITDKKYSFTVNYDSVYRARFRQRGVKAMDGYEVVSSSDPANPDYVLIEYTIIVSVDPNYPNGVVSGGGTFEEGTVVALVAVPNNGYKTEWYLNNNLVGSDNTIQVIANADKEYITRFIALKFVPYIEQGLTDSFDTKLNKTTEYSDSIRHWENLMMEQYTFTKTENGYVSNGLTDSFDSIGKSVDSPAEWISDIQ